MEIRQDGILVLYHNNLGDSNEFFSGFFFSKDREVFDDKCLTGL